MNNFPRVSFLTPVCLAMILTGPRSAAGPPDPDHIAADAQWVVHIDVEAASKSRLVNMIVEERDDFDIEARDQMNEVAEEIGLDPLHDFFSVTIYGRGDDEKPAAIIATMTDAVDQVLEKLKEAEPDYRILTIEGYECHVWSDGCGYIREGGDRRLVVVAEDIAGLIDALEVIDDASPSLEIDEAPGLVPMKPGTFLYVQTGDVRWIGKPDQGGEDGRNHDDVMGGIVAEKAKALVLQIGEFNNWLTGYLILETGSENDAHDIVDIGQALIVIGKTIAKRKQELEPLEDVLRAIRIDSEGDAVHVQLKFDVEKLPLKEESDEEEVDENDGDESGTRLP